MAHYVDTSALVKLVVHEADTPALLAWITATDPVLVTSGLARTELMRATRRAAPHEARRAIEVLDTLIITELTPSILDAAGRLDPAEIRTLDAIHICAALDLGDDLETLVTYDDRMARVAEGLGIAVRAPA